MIYEKYKAKIEKLAKAFKIVKRFRFPIIAVLVFVVAITTTLLATRGIILHEDKPNNIVYGDPFTYDVNAFMSDVTYEYYNEELGKWTTEAPTSVGEHRVRARAEGSFGGKRYGKEHTYTIAPRMAEVEITSKSIIYGNDPQIKVELVEGDEIRSVDFDYQGLSGNIADQVQVTPILESIEVYNEEGVNVTAFYRFSKAEEPTNITFIKRAITVSTGGGEKTYDGTELVNQTATVSQNTSLAFDDELVAENFTALVNADSNVKNKADFCITNEKWGDVSGYYTITPDWGTLTVSKREIVITSASDSKDYDGRKLTAEDNESVVGSLADGEIFEINYQGAQLLAGESDNLFTVKVRKEALAEDGSVTYTTDNYRITRNYGKLNVSTRKIQFLSGSAERAYDGTALTCHDAWVVEDEANGLMGLATGDTAIYSYTGSITTALVKDGAIIGVENTYTVEIYNAQNQRVTDSYLRDTKYGELKILTVGLGFSTLSGEKVYDGRSYTVEGYRVTKGELFADDHIELTGYASILYAGDKDNTIESFRILSKDGKDVSDSYTVLETDIQWGTLTVTPRQVVLISDPASKIYDGTPLTSNKASFADYVYYDVFSKLENGHSVSTQFIGSQTNVGSSANEHGGADVFFDFNGVDVTESFEICAKTYGSLTVTHRKIQIQTADYTWRYDGQQHKDGDGLEISCTSTKALPEQGDYLDLLTDLGHTIRKIEGSSNYVVNVPAEYEEYFNYTQYEVVLDGDNAVNGNYQITYVHGTLSVLPRELTVRSFSAEKIYNATVLMAEGCALDPESPHTLVEGHVLFGGNYYSKLINVGTAKNTFEVFVDLSDYSYLNTVDWDTSALERNYLIKKETGTLEVVHRRIMLQMKDRVWAYDGQLHYDDHAYGNGDLVFVDNANITDPLKKYCDIVPVHNIGIDVSKILSLKTIIDKGTVENNIFDCFAIYDRNGTNVIDNYSLSKYEGKNGTLTVTPLNIYVQTHTHTDWLYDGRYLHDDCTYSNGDLRQPTWEFVSEIPYTDYLEVDAYTEIKNVGERKENVLTFKVFADRNGKKTDTTKNYNIYTGEYEGTDLAYGVLEIIPRPLIIQSDSADKTYDGELLEAKGYKLLWGTELASGQYLELTYTAQAVNAGVTLNTFTYKIKDESGSEYDEEGVLYVSNYDIETIEGKLTIFKREITVRASEWKGVYDGEEHVLLSGSYTLPIGSLAKGEVLSVETIGVRATNYRPGGYVHEIVEDSARVSKQTTEGITDTTGNYDITYENGLLTIERRTLYLTVHAHEKVYDGTALSCEKDCEYTDEDLLQGEIDGVTYYDLVEGHSFRVLSYAAITRVGSIPNYVQLEVLDENENSTGLNYAVKYAEGKNLTVTQRVIKVKTHTHDTETYDATNHSCYAYGCTYGEGDLILKENVYYDLASGHYLEVAPYEGIVNVADNGNENVVSFLIHNESGDYMDSESGWYGDNYIIEQERGTLSLNKRAIYVTTRSQSWTYDGQEHYQKSIMDFLNEEESYSVILRNAVKYNNDDLTVGEIDGKQYYDLASATHVILIATRDESSTVKEVAISAKNILTFQVADISMNLSEGLTVGGNYEIVVSKEYGVLSITPRNLAIVSEDAEKVYDGTPLTQHSIKYVAGTTIAPKQTPVIEYAGSQTVAYTQTDEDLPYAESLNTYVLKGILDENGDPVDMRNYNILSTDFGTLRVLKREILIQSNSLTGTYSGEEWVIEPNTYRAIPQSEGIKDAMVEGHTLTVKTTGARSTNATEEPLPNTITFWSITADGDPNVHKNYIVSTKTGTLNVYKRTIGVKMHGDDAKHTKIFDGSPISCLELGCVYTEEHDLYIGAGYYDLVEGHSLRIVDAPALTNAGRLLNKVDLEVVGDGAEGNYEIEYVTYHNLVVNPRPLLVELHSHEQTYDGTVLSCKELGCEYTTEKDLREIDNQTYFGLVPGHKLVFNSCATATYVHENKVNKVSLYVEDNEQNYRIDFVKNVGELTIHPRDIWIKTTHTVSYSYDGNPKYDLSKYGDNDLYVLEENGVNYERLVKGDSISPKATESTRITNVWESGAKNEVVFRVLNSARRDITTSYNIRCEAFGTITVEKRAIRIRAKTVEYEYDKQSKEIEGGEYEDNFVYVSNANGKTLKVISAHVLKVEVSGARVEVFGKAINKLYPETIRIVSKETGSEMLNGHMLIENYEIENWADWFNEEDNHGYLEIFARKIKVNTGSVNEVYDGNTYYDPVVYSKYTENCIGGSGILDGQEIYLKDGSRKSILNVGSFRNALTAEDFVIIDEVDGDVTKYYSFTFNYGTLQITPRPLYVETHTHHFGVYDGNMHSCVTEDATCQGVYTVTEEDGLLSNHTVRIYQAYNIIDAGTEENKLILEVLDADGNSMTHRGMGKESNYEIIYTYGTLTLDKRVLDIKTNGMDETYDGSWWCYEKDDTNGYEVSGTTADNQYLHITFTGQQRDAYMEDGSLDYGISQNTFTWTVTNRSGSADYSGNYQVNTISLGDLIVRKREITIESDDRTEIYNGRAWKGNSYTITSGSLADKGEDAEWISMTYTSSQTDVGSCENTFEYVIYRGLDPSTDNYAVTTKFGTLTVTVREVHIQAKSLPNVPYKAAEYVIYPGEWDYVVGTPNRFALDHEDYFVLPTSGARATKVNETRSNTVEGEPTFSDSSISMDNYKIITQDGVLNIVPRRILVVEHSYKDEHTHLDKYYDGTPISCKDCTYNESDLEIDNENYFDLLDGHYLELKEYTKQTEAGIVYNNITVSVGGEGAEGNYQIDYARTGRIYVRRRPIKLVTQDYVNVYDGTEQSDTYTYTNADADMYADTLSEDGKTTFMTVLPQHTLFVYDRATILNVNNGVPVENEIFFLIRDENGDDVTPNYDYESYIKYGTLTLQKRKIKVQLHHVKWAYDEKVHYEGDEEEFNPQSYTESDLIEENGYYTTLGENDYLVIDRDKYYSTILANELPKFADNVLGLKVLRWGNPSTVDLGNYEIEYVKGIMEISKSVIVITPYTDSKPFDGEDLVTEAGAVSVQGKLIEGHRVVIESKSRSLDAFTIGTAQEFEFSDKEKATLDIVDENGNGVRGYYDYTFGTGYLYIEKCDLIVKPQSLQKYYDGKDLTTEAGKYDVIVKGNALNKYTLEISSGVFSLDAEILETPKVIEFSEEEKASIVIKDENGKVLENHTKYFNIRFEKGQLLIKKIVVTLKSPDAEKDYDGTPLENKVWVVENISAPIPDGHEFSYEITGSITDPGRTKNTIAYSVTVDGVDVSDKYYDFRVTEGVLVVNVRNSNSVLYIKPEDIVMQAEEQLIGSQYTDFNISKIAYRTGDEYGVIDCEGTSTLASMIKHWNYSYEATIVTSGTTRMINSFTLYDKNGTDVTNLYQIQKTTGQYKVIDGEFIYINVQEIAQVYDNGDMRIESGMFEVRSFFVNDADGWKRVAFKSGTLKNVKAGRLSKDTLMDFVVVYNKDNVDVTEAYIDKIYFSESRPIVYKQEVKAVIAGDNTVAQTGGALLDGDKLGFNAQKRVAVLRNGLDVTDNYLLFVEES